MPLITSDNLVGHEKKKKKSRRGRGWKLGSQGREREVRWGEGTRGRKVTNMATDREIRERERWSAVEGEGWKKGG